MYCGGEQEEQQQQPQEEDEVVVMDLVEVDCHDDFLSYFLLDLNFFTDHLSSHDRFSTSTV